MANLCADCGHPTANRKAVRCRSCRDASRRLACQMCHGPKTRKDSPLCWQCYKSTRPAATCVDCGVNLTHGRRGLRCMGCFRALPAQTKEEKAAALRAKRAAVIRSCACGARLAVRQRSCMTCSKARKLAWTRANREANREVYRARSNAWHRSNPAKLNEARRRRRKDNPEVVLERERRRQEARILVAGERLDFNAMPPELRELAVLVKQARVAISKQKRSVA